MRVLAVGISVRAFVESAVKSGYRVIALDAFGDRDLRKIAETRSLHHDFQTVYSPDKLLKASRTISCDAIVYTSNLENYPDILAQFGKSHPVIGNPPGVVASVRNWKDLFGRLSREGFSVPETIFTGETGPFDEERTWLSKPLLSGGGHGICYFRPETQSFSDEDEGSCVPDRMLQEYIPGKSCSAAFVANGERSVVLGIAEQLIGLNALGAPGFRYCGNILPLSEILDHVKGGGLLDEVRQLTNFLTQEYGLKGVNGIDFILNDDQIYLTEVNPRYSASMEVIERAYGLPVFELHMQSILNAELPEFELEVESGKGKYYGKGYLYTNKDVEMPDTGNWIDRGFRDIPESGERIRRDSPVCTILAEEPARAELLETLTRQAAGLKEEING